MNDDSPDQPTSIHDVLERIEPFHPLTLELLSMQLDVRPLQTLDPTTPLTDEERERFLRLFTVLDRADELMGRYDVGIWLLQRHGFLSRDSGIQACRTTRGFVNAMSLLGQLERKQLQGL